MMGDLPAVPRLQGDEISHHVEGSTEIPPSSLGAGSLGGGSLEQARA
jgi:hypothetical protein